MTFHRVRVPVGCSASGAASLTVARLRAPGLKATLEREPPSGERTYRDSPADPRLQSRASPSKLAVARRFPSGLNATSEIRFRCPNRVREILPDRQSQIRSPVSWEPVASIPSGPNATLVTGLGWGRVCRWPVWRSRTVNRPSPFSLSWSGTMARYRPSWLKATVRIAGPGSPGRVSRVFVAAFQILASGEWLAMARREPSGLQARETMAGPMARGGGGGDPG